MKTAISIPDDDNLAWARAPGNVLLPAKVAGLAKDSVADTSQIIAIDRGFSPSCSSIWMGR